MTDAPMVSTEPRTTESPTAATTASFIFDPDACTDNPQDYNVNIDLQSQFDEDGIATCAGDEEEQIAAAISAAMNEAFPTTVSDWDGQAFFGVFGFDSNQEVNNLGSLRRKQRRRLGSSLLPPINLVVDDTGRSLQESSCPSRGDFECTADFCRWGCLTAKTVRVNPTWSLICS
jgi:hypothetical protein